MRVSVDIDPEDVLEEISAKELREALAKRECDDRGIIPLLRDIYADLLCGRTQYAITALDNVLRELE